MTGMNTLGSSGLCDYESRMVTIEVDGVCQQSVTSKGHYQVRVPFSQMSQALQTINHQGGKVASIQVAGDRPAPKVAVNSTPKKTASKAPSSKKSASKKSASKSKSNKTKADTQSDATASKTEETKEKRSFRRKRR